MVYNIAIIGAGAIGNRHFEGLIKTSTNEIAIFIVDPNPVALKNIAFNYNQLAQNKNIKSLSYLENINELPKELSLAIIATTADVRYGLTLALLKHSFVKYLILEKVVFQKVDHFDSLSKLLTKNKIKAWVNCPRRIFPFYQYIKKIIKGNKLSLKFLGKNWGLCCNSIHFIDLFSFLTDSNSVSINYNQLEKSIYPSKRNGFIELRGKLRVNTGEGDYMDLIDTDSLKHAFSIIKIESDDISFEIRESKKQLLYTNGKIDTVQKKRIDIPYQSDLTGSIVNQILTKGESELISFEASSKIHKPLLNAFNNHLFDVTGKKYDRCPIT